MKAVLVQGGWHIAAAAPFQPVRGRAAGFRRMCHPRAIADFEGARLVAGASSAQAKSAVLPVSLMSAGGSEALTQSRQSGAYRKPAQRHKVYINAGATVSTGPGHGSRPLGPTQPSAP